MRALVTGGAGFIGSHIVDLLLARGYRVRVLDSLHPRVHPHGRPRYVPETVELVLGDVRDRAALGAALDGVDVVFHLAAYQDYMPDFSTFFDVNTVSTALLYELIVERRLPVRTVVLASSQAVYGEGPYRCAAHGVLWPGPRPAAQLAGGDWEHRCPQCSDVVEALPITEERVQPHTAYGISKYALELAALALGAKYDLPTVCLRYSITLGPRNAFHNAYSGVCRTFTLRALHGQPPLVYEDGLQRRDYVYVADVAAASVLVAEHTEANGQVYNVGGARAWTVLDVAQAVLEAAGRTDLAPLVAGDYRYGDTRHTVSDSSKLRALGWRPTLGLAEMVAAYVGWARAQPDLAATYEAAEARMRAQQVLRRAAAAERAIPAHDAAGA
ncbi:MAG: NAD-dependent epimerase/dehydratase family protein [Chloroflexi bacterium]|nr:NAD-dependent epimerase/dehydratase family protein [Chloroflexota bacterium]